MAESILIVEDEETLGKNLATFLAREGHRAACAASGAEAMGLLGRQSFDIVLTDIQLGDLDGVELLKRVRSEAPDTVVLMMTAYASIHSAVEAFRNGAHDYLLKPFSLQELRQKIHNIAQYRKLIRENAILRREIQRQRDDFNMIAESSAISDVKALVRKVATSKSNVLVTGESGTGKELVSRAIHALSPNPDALLVALNVAAIPDTLIESYLFGHERGAFTGADRARLGAFRKAEGGTLFLDEIAELPLQLQPKLLRALEEKEIMPVGADAPVKVDTRVIAATHRDLERMVQEGSFRQDLLFRINVLAIHIPPLRERVEDIPVLVRHFVDRFCRELRRPRLDLDNQAMRRLMSYPWSKGNVRELSNVIERAVILCEGDTIRVEDLPEVLQAAGVTPSTTDLRQALKQFEYRHIASVLESVGGNRELTAHALGISPATLYRHMERLGLAGYEVGSEADA
ncbi:MAG: sigma-54 dependent transcriptional regulator [Gammaproteobacteria bacterium]